MCYQL